MRRCSLDVLGSEVFDTASFRLPINQWSIDFRVLNQCLDIIDGHAFGVFTSEKWRHSPAFLAVIRLDLCHSLKRSLGADFVRPLLSLQIGIFDLALLHQHLAGKPQRLEIMQRGRAALGFDVLGDQLVYSRLICVLRKNCWRDDGGENERNYGTQMHMNLGDDIRHRSATDIQRNSQSKALLDALLAALSYGDVDSG